MYTDSHAHLDGKRFDADRAEVIERARAAGVTTLLAIGNGDGPGTGTLDCAIKLAAEYDWIYATVGIHPHEAALAKAEDFETLEQLARSPKVLAWGEIGLDYFYDHSPRDVQQQVFVQQMEMARAAELPIIIHCRPSDNSDNAWDDTLRLVREHWVSTGLGGVMHCFTGNLDQARASLDAGVHSFLRRQSHLSQGAEHSRRCGHHAAGSLVHRDRLPLPGAGAASRQAQRTGLCGRDRPADWRAARPQRRRGRPTLHGKFPAILPPAEA